jgi:hypothetical protein
LAEDRDPMRFGEWHEAYLEIIANQIALGIDHMLDRQDDTAEPVTAARPAASPTPAAPVRAAGAKPTAVVSSTTGATMRFSCTTST